MAWLCRLRSYRWRLVLGSRGSRADLDPAIWQDASANQARYAEHLRRTTPIEDAQRIRGVGPAIVGKLRAAGIEHLAALAGSDPRAVSGIGPQRAALLAEWAVERGRAIARLVSSDADFPGRAVLDAVADEHEQPLRQELAQLHTQADTARERLATWRDARPAALVALAAPVEGVS